MSAISSSGSVSASWNRRRLVENHTTPLHSASASREQRRVIALDVPGVVHPLGVGERRRIDDDEVPAPAGALGVGEEVADVGLDQLAGEPVEREVLGGPAEVGVRQIDRGGLHPGGRGVDRERAGVAEQVEHGARRLGGDLRARDAMVEEQAGVDVVAQVDAERVAALVHGAPRALVGLALVLLGGAAVGEPLAALDEHLAGRQHRRDRRDRRVEPRVVAGLALERAVVVDHQRALVAVDRDRDLRDVAVVDPPAGDALAPGPLAEVARVLAHPVGEHRHVRHLPPGISMTPSVGGAPTPVKHLPGAHPPY